MSELCEALERSLDGAAADDRAPHPAPERVPELAEHLAGCPACRERLAAHRLLAATLGNRPVPPLPAGFEARLRRRIRAAERAEAGDRKGAAPGLRFLLPAYWTAAGVAAAALLRWIDLQGIGFPAGLGPSAAAALLATAGITAAGLLLPAVALLRSRPG